MVAVGSGVSVAVAVEMGCAVDVMVGAGGKVAVAEGLRVKLGAGDGVAVGSRTAGSAHALKLKSKRMPRVTVFNREREILSIPILL
jgi:hypothetical protein